MIGSEVIRSLRLENVPQNGILVKFCMNRNFVDDDMAKISCHCLLLQTVKIYWRQESQPLVPTLKTIIPRKTRVGPRGPISNAPLKKRLLPESFLFPTSNEVGTQV